MSEFITALDWAKACGPDNSVESRIIKMMSRENSLFNDIPIVEGNLATGHMIVQQTGLPPLYYRRANKGVPDSKASTAQITETIAIMEGRSKVDKDIAELNGDIAKFRRIQFEGFVQSARDTYETNMFYSSTSPSNPEYFDGLSVRYSSLSAQNARNIIDASGTGSNNTSIWLTVWGPNTISGIYPKGSKMGLQHEDLGLQEVLDENGDTYRAYVDWYQWKHGLALHDWRFAGRICNIDTSNLISNSSAADLIDALIELTYKVENLSAGRPVIYMNRTVARCLDKQRRDDVISGGGLEYNMVDGKRVMDFRGIPIHVTDALLDTEARVV